ncbi:hypothetical protein ABT263_32560 [Kitasatospora sp. NPDC001603]
MSDQEDLPTALAAIGLAPGARAGWCHWILEIHLVDVERGYGSTSGCST